MRHLQSQATALMSSEEKQGIFLNPFPLKDFLLPAFLFLALASVNQSFFFFFTE